MSLCPRVGKKNLFKPKIKAVPIKVKMNGLDYLKIKDLCLLKDALKKVGEHFIG